MPNTIQSVDRALTLLELVIERADGVGVRELAREANLKAPTAQQLLKTLQARGFLHFDPDSRAYQAGRSLAKLCEKIDPMAALRDSLRDPVQAFHDKLGETTIAQTMIEGAARIILEFAGNHPLTVRHGLVVIDDPHLWASGSVVLAWQKREYLDRYMRTRQWSKEQILDYFRLLDDIREQGLAEMINVNDSGVAALGAPVLDTRGDFVCAIGCSAPLTRWNDERREIMIHELRHLVAEIGPNL